MPNVKYSGSKGIVQSTGSGQFHVSGVGIAHDVETITQVTADANLASHGPTIIEDIAGGPHTLTVPDPTLVEGAAGQQKLIYVKANVTGGTIRIASDETANLVGDDLGAVGDYCLLVWTGSDWVVAAEVSALP